MAYGNIEKQPDNSKNLSESGVEGVLTKNRLVSALGWLKERTVVDPNETRYKGFPVAVESRTIVLKGRTKTIEDGVGAKTKLLIEKGQKGGFNTGLLAEIVAGKVNKLKESWKRLAWLMPEIPKKMRQLLERMHPRRRKFLERVQDLKKKY